MKNTRDIMTRAHAMTRAALQPGDNYAVTLAAALRICWSDALQPGALAEWQRMTGAEQHAALQRMTGYAMRKDAAETDSRGEYRPNRFAWVKDANDFAAIVADAWTRVSVAVVDPRYSADSLKRILYRAVCSAAQRINRAERRNASALHIDAYTAEDGTERRREYIELQAGAAAERIATDPYTAAAIRDSIERAAADHIDRVIIRMRGAGYTQAEIAARVKMSQQAVNKRIQAIKARYNGEDAVSA